MKGSLQGEAAWQQRIVGACGAGRPAPCATRPYDPLLPRSLPPQRALHEDGPPGGLWRGIGLLGRAAGWALIGLVRAYQLFVSPLLPPTCRFEPTCSQYMIEALRKRGPIIGTLKGLWRLARCNPLCRAGYDPVDRDA